jgi:hypothetical protein
MRIRYQADADLKLSIIQAMLPREPGLDFRNAQAANLVGLSDSEVLAVAARESRVLVSHDRRTMPHYFPTFIRTQSSPSLLIIPQDLPMAAAIDELLLIWLASEAEEWVDRICYLPL